MVYDFHNLQDSDRHGTPALQTVRDLCTKYNFQEPADLAGGQAILEDGISFISRVVDLTDQLAKTKKTCSTYKKEQEIYSARLNDRASQRIPLQKKTADTLTHASRAVISLAVSLKRAHKKVCMVSEEHDEYLIKREQTDGLTNIGPLPRKS